MRAFLRLLAFASAVALLVYGVLSGTDTVWLMTLYAATVPIGYIFFSMVPRETIGWRRNTWKIAAVLVIGFIMLSMQVLRQQFIVAADVIDHPNNPRKTTQELRTQRGRVFDRNGTEIAGRKIAPNGYVTRTYPEPASSYVVGYYSATIYGADRLEERYDDYLSGERGDPLERTRGNVLHRPLRGNDLYLTLDARLQQLGQELLGERKGSIVAMNPRTGEILAMVNNPTYNSSDLVFDPSLPNKEAAARVRTAYNALIEAGDARLVNRAIQGLYQPGSTFKTVTAAGALDTGVATPDKQYQDTGVVSVGGFVIRDPNRPDENKVQWTFTEGYMYSLNAVFAQVGLNLKSAGMREYARRFYFEREIPFDLQVTPSQVLREPDFLTHQLGLASTAIGQGQLLATPLQVVMTSTAIANGGVMPRPYLVANIKTPGGRTVESRQPEQLEAVVKPEVAGQMTEIMQKTVNDGTGRQAQIPGVPVAGKTGTAQLGENQDPHAWFTGFAPVDDPKIAVAVLVENGGQGSEVAAPIAREVIEAHLR